MIDAELLLGIAVILLAGIVSGLAAFGFALVAVPPLLLIYDPPTVTAVMILLLMATRWVVLKDSWRAVKWRPVAAILPTAIIGTALGAILLRDLDGAYIKLIASLVVVGSAVSMMSGGTIPGIESSVAAPMTGLVSGTLNSTIGIAGPPLVVFSAARGFAPLAFRGTFTVITYCICAMSIVFLTRQGLIDRTDLHLAVALLAPAVAGTWVGQVWFRRFSDVQFQRLVLVLLLLTGLVGTVAAILDMVL